MANAVLFSTVQNEKNRHQTTLWSMSMASLATTAKTHNNQPHECSSCLPIALIDSTSSYSQGYAFIVLETYEVKEKTAPLCHRLEPSSPKNTTIHLFCDGFLSFLREIQRYTIVSSRQLIVELKVCAETEEIGSQMPSSRRERVVAAAGAGVTVQNHRRNLRFEVLNFACF